MGKTKRKSSKKRKVTTVSHRDMSAYAQMLRQGAGSGYHSSRGYSRKTKHKTRLNPDIERAIAETIKEGKEGLAAARRVHEKRKKKGWRAAAKQYGHEVVATPGRVVETQLRVAEAILNPAARQNHYYLKRNPTHGRTYAGKIWADDGKTWEIRRTYFRPGSDKANRLEDAYSQTLDLDYDDEGHVYTIEWKRTPQGWEHRYTDGSDNEWIVTARQVSSSSRARFNPRADVTKMSDAKLTRAYYTTNNQILFLKVGGRDPRYQKMLQKAKGNLEKIRKEMQRRGLPMS